VALRATAHWTARIGKTNESYTQSATPLVEGAERVVVGFVCDDSPALAHRRARGCCR
jgi:hypothetical protein